MWFFSALDSWRTAQMIRSGLTPDIAEDIFVKRFTGNPKLWGIVLTVLGGAFLLQSVFNLRGLIRGLMPAMLIGLGIYILRGYIFKPADEDKWKDFDSARPAPLFISASGRLPRTSEYETVERGRDQRYGGWGSA
jgi:hypothetical protein